jgi:hypothetical protein
MTCQLVGFAHGECLVEIDSQSAKKPGYTAFLSLLEEGGAIVRPLVRLNGRRLEIHAPSEPLALHSAINYLRKRFGAVDQPERECTLASSSFGPPVVVVD